MIEVLIDDNMMKIAKKRAEELGQLRNSITRGEGNLAGILGELAINKVLGGEIKDKRNFDIVFENGIKIDVKTKRCKSKPEEHYECSVSDYNTSQKCDKYVFVRILNDYSKAWILGCIDKNVYYEKAVFIKQGQIDRSNGWRAKCDCWNLPISSLDPIDTLNLLSSGTCKE